MTMYYFSSPIKIQKIKSNRQSQQMWPFLANTLMVFLIILITQFLLQSRKSSFTLSAMRDWSAISLCFVSYVF